MLQQPRKLALWFETKNMNDILQLLYKTGIFNPLEFHINRCVMLLNELFNAFTFMYKNNPRVRSSNASPAFDYSHLQKTHSKNPVYRIIYFFMAHFLTTI